MTSARHQSITFILDRYLIINPRVLTIWEAIDMSHAQVTQSLHTTNKYWWQNTKGSEQNYHIDGLVQDCGIAIAHAIEILQSCTKPSICLAQSCTCKNNSLAPSHQTKLSLIIPSLSQRSLVFNQSPKFDCIHLISSGPFHKEIMRWSSISCEIFFYYFLKYSELIMLQFCICFNITGVIAIDPIGSLELRKSDFIKSGLPTHQMFVKWALDHDNALAQGCYISLGIANAPEIPQSCAMSSMKNLCPHSLTDTKSHYTYILPFLIQNLSSFHIIQTISNIFLPRMQYHNIKFTISWSDIIKTRHQQMHVPHWRDP